MFLKMAFIFSLNFLFPLHESWSTTFFDKFLQDNSIKGTLGKEGISIFLPKVPLQYNCKTMSAFYNQGRLQF